MKRSDLLIGIVHQGRLSENDHRPVVDRVMERRTRKHQAINQRYGHTHVYALFQGAQHSARRRSMNVQVIPDPPVGCWNHNGLAIGDESDVANEGFIKDLKHRSSIVFGSVWQSFQSSSLGWRKSRQVVYSIAIAVA